LSFPLLLPLRVFAFPSSTSTMSDSSPFDDAPQYEDAPTGGVDVEDEEEKEDDDEDDPFADVPAPSSSSHDAPSLDSLPLEPVIEQETPLSIWERERAEILRDRQSKADAEKQTQLATAKEEITKFYADQEAKLEKTKKVNRADEKNYRSDTAAIFTNGTKWEKVNRLVNLAPKHGEKPGTSRVERYRKLLTSLKAEKGDKKGKAKPSA